MFGLGIDLGIGPSRRRSGGGGTLAPTTMQSSITDGPVTWTFAAAAPVGQYADGGWFAVNPSVTSTAPASIVASGTYSNANPYTDRTIHGLESNPGSEGGTGANPVNTPQGFDTLVWDTITASKPTEFEYSDALNVAPEKTAVPLSGPRTLLKAVSITASLNPSGRDRLNDLKFLTLVSSVPNVNSFARFAGDTDKAPWFTTADLDLSVLPSLALPSGAVLPTMAYMRGKLGRFQAFKNMQLFARGISPNNQQNAYGGDIARDITEAMLFTMTAGVASADRLEIVIKLVQAGLDFANGAEIGRRWSSATFSFGGSHQWMKILIVYAARLLRNASNTTARAIVQKWADANQQKVWADDMMMFPVSRIVIETTATETLTDRLWPIPYPDWAENTVDWTSKPSGAASGLSFEHSYRNINSFPLMSAALIARLLGAQTLWGNAQFFDYIDRFYNIWLARGATTDSYFGAYARRMVQDYFTANSPAYTGVAAPSLVRREARGRFAWIEASENFDIASQPLAADLTVTVDGLGVSLTAVTTTASGTQSTASPSVNQTEPTISVASATGIRIGQRVVCAALPPDTRVISVNGTSIGITTHVPATFTPTSITFHNTLVYGRALVAVLPVPLTSNTQPVTIAYTPGASPARNLRGVGIGAISSASATNRTGELPQAATTKTFAYSGPTQATRQYSGTTQPPSEAIRRFRLSLRFKLDTAMAINETLLANATGATTSLRLYAATATDLRLLFGGRQMRLPGALTGVPLDTDLTLHLFIDGTGTSITAVNRAALVWDGGGSNNLSVTGSTGVVDGTFATDIATVLSLGLFTHAVGTGNNSFNGSISELIVGWGDAAYPLPADFTAAAFGWNADWGGNGQNVWGQSQLYYAGTLADWNGLLINRGNGGARALTPRRLLNAEGDLLTEYGAHP